jgi:Domain of unknown function (DUF4440)
VETLSTHGLEWTEEVTAYLNRGDFLCFPSRPFFSKCSSAKTLGNSGGMQTRSYAKVCRRLGASAIVCLLFLVDIPIGASLQPATTSPDVAQLRQDTQALLDAIAPGNVAVWQRLLDPAFIQVDENDIVRNKTRVLSELKPLGPGLTGTLVIDEFRPIVMRDFAVVTHEDNESLDYHSQMILSRFRMTDTWRRTPAGWRLVASQVLAVQKDPPAITLDESTMCSYSGKYALTPEIVATLRCDGNRLIVERAGRPSREFRPEVKDVFFEPGEPRTRRLFVRDATDKVQGFVDRREERDIRWTKVP